MSKYYKNIYVTQASYLETDQSGISMTTEMMVETTKNLVVSYSNLTDEISVMHTNTLFTLTNATSFGDGCGDYGTHTVGIGYYPTVLQDAKDTVIISCASDTLRIPVAVSVNKRTQLITWTDDLSSLTTESELKLTASAAPSALPIVYTSSDSTVAYVNDTCKLVILKAGTVTITAAQPGNGIYRAAENIAKSAVIGVAESGTVVSMVFDNAANDKDWHNTANWKPNRNAVPDLTQTALLEAPAIVTENAYTRHLTFAEGSSLAISPVGFLRADTISGATTSNLLLQSDSTGTGSLAFRGEAPQATVQMYSKGYKDFSGYQWQYFGIPVTSYSARNLQSATACRWSASEHGWLVLANDSVLQPYAGYCITQKSPTAYAYSGQLNKGTHTYPLVYQNDGNDYDGCNLLANAYTAPIDLTELTIGNFVNAEATVYIYNRGSYSNWESNGNSGSTTGSLAGQYTTLPIASVGSLDLQVIPSMQAFFVLATANGRFTLPYDSVVWLGTKDNQPMRIAAKTGEPVEKLIVTVNGSRFSDQLYLLQFENCTRNYDNGYDGRKMFGMNTAAPQLFATEECGRMAVNAVHEFKGQYIGLQVGEDEQYTLKFVEAPAETLYLHDLLTRESILIEAGALYEFSAAGFTEKRFLISDQMQVEENQGTDIKLIYGLLTVNNLSGSDQWIQLYDMYGRCLLRQRLEAAAQTDISVQHFPHGTYIVKAGQNIKKIVL